MIIVGKEQKDNANIRRMKTYPLRTPRTRLSMKNDPTMINRINALQLIIGK